MADVETPPVRSWTIGDVTVTRVVERQTTLPGPGLIPALTPELVARHRSWLHPHFVDDDGQLLLSIHALVIDTPDRRIVVDTCMGNRPLPIVERVDTDFLERFEAAGFPPASVDTVVCTHLHFDHVGWNTVWSDDAGAWVPTFPGARYLFGAEEVDHWRREESPITNLADTVEPVFAAGLADLVATDHRLCDEVWLEPSPGHTPGHVCVRVASGGAEAVITGDMTHHPIQLAEPHLGSAPDALPELAVQTRRAFRDRHGDTPTLVIGTHFAGPTAGRLVRDGDGWRLDV